MRKPLEGWASHGCIWWVRTCWLRPVSSAHTAKSLQKRSTEHFQWCAKYLSNRQLPWPDILKGFLKATICPDGQTGLRPPVRFGKQKMNCTVIILLLPHLQTSTFILFRIIITLLCQPKLRLQQKKKKTFGFNMRPLVLKWNNSH